MSNSGAQINGEGPGHTNERLERPESLIDVNEASLKERRESPRVPVVEGVAILLGLDSKVRVSRIADISGQGLSLYYEDGGIMPDSSLNFSVLVAEQDNGRGLFMTNVWGRVVSAGDPSGPEEFSKRYGLKFDHLNQWHSYLLKDFFSRSSKTT